MVDVSAVTQRFSGRPTFPSAVGKLPVARSGAAPFVAGESVEEAVEAVGELAAHGYSASLLYLAEPESQATARLVQLQLVEALSAHDLGSGTDLTVDLPHLGLGTADVGHVRSEVAAICGAAAAEGISVTLAGLSRSSIESALSLRQDLAGEFPDLGVTLAAHLTRTEGDCLDLAAAGARVRLFKREAHEGTGVAFTKPHEVDLSYVRCLRILLQNGARTVVATHDSRLLEIAQALAGHGAGEEGHCSYQFRRGITPGLAEQLLAAGESVSILLPFGPAWADYVSNRISFTPISAGKALRSAVGRGK